MDDHMGEVDEAVSGAIEQGRDSRLNSLIAIVAGLAATAMGIDNIKDGNVTQAMAQAQAHAIDAWSYYQAKSTKQNLAESTLDELQVLRVMPGAPGADLDKKIAAYQGQVTRYDKEKNDIKAQAEG